MSHSMICKELELWFHTFLQHACLLFLLNSQVCIHMEIEFVVFAS
jgi:hypothetical protein